MPSVKIASGRTGRPKAPLEMREIRSDTPHRGRLGPPDLPVGETLGMQPLPPKPPLPLGKYEKECWDMIAETQAHLGKSGWIFKCDEAFLLSACILWGQIRSLREDMKRDRKSGVPIVNPETGRMDPRIAVEGTLLAKYMTALERLGIAPSKRQVMADENKSESEQDSVFTR